MKHFPATTAYSNQLQQLLVSVSKYYYVDNYGFIESLKNPGKVVLKNPEKARREFLVYYVLKDHFSGNCYVKVCTIKALHPLAEFLYNGWRGRRDKQLTGMPELLSVPKNISSPELLDGLAGLGMEVCHPPSGFASGIAIIRQLEKALSMLGHDMKLLTVPFSGEIMFVLYEMICRKYDDVDRRDHWRSTLPAGHPVYPGGKEEFMQLFSGPEADKNIPPLTLERVLPSARYNVLPVILQPDENKFSLTELIAANQYYYSYSFNAYEAEMVGIAKKALKMSSFCLQAYNILAELSNYEREKELLYTNAVKAGRYLISLYDSNELAVNQPQLLKSSVEKSFAETLSGLGEICIKNDRYPEAIELYKEVLNYPFIYIDNVKSMLTLLLLRENRTSEARSLIETYNDNSYVDFFYNKALFRYVDTGGDKEDQKASELLVKAIERNSFVPEIILAEKSYYRRYEDGQPGDKNEAISYAIKARLAWQKIPGALAWLKDINEQVAARADKTGYFSIEDTFYQIKITLMNIDPPIWRRLLIPAGITFYRLHEAIQIAFGWLDYHLFVFDFADIAVSDDSDIEEFPGDFEVRNIDAKTEKVDRLLRERKRFIYHYDFGDSWFHDIILEEVITGKKRDKRPVCLAGARHRPPEDVGGISGYQDFLEIIYNPHHPERDEYLAWSEKDTDGRIFDPEYFNLVEINHSIKAEW